MCCNAYYVFFGFDPVTSFVFLLISGLVYSESQVNAETINFDSKLDSTSLSSHIQKRDNPSETNTVWFGPRLGRKKRSVTPEMCRDSYKCLFENHPEDLAFFMKDKTPSLTNGLWSSSHHDHKKRFQYNDDPTNTASEQSNFEYYVLQLLKNYPRALSLFVNKNFGDDQLVKTRYGRGNTWPDEEGKMIIKTPPFSPRLGRRSLIPLKPRLGRANNNPEASAVFKPRLGRDPNMNDFSEYIDGQNGIDYRDH